MGHLVYVIFYDHVYWCQVETYFINLKYTLSVNLCQLLYSYLVKIEQFELETIVCDCLEHLNLKPRK